MTNRFAFTARDRGPWRILSLDAVAGPPLAPAAALDIAPVTADAAAKPEPYDNDGAPRVAPPVAPWVLHGLASNVRYATRAELIAMRARTEPLGRPHASLAALIPITKSAAWWDLAQDERRAILEETSHHTAIGMDYMPAVARKLYHCRDIGQPFDFLTWFEFAPEHRNAFEDLVGRLRATAEWTYVTREVDIRLERTA